ncbi:hypothetical protein R6Z07F_017685 [Ovis aries]
MLTGSGDPKEEEEEEEELVDPLTTVREQCEQLEKCVKARERLELCDERVSSRRMPGAAWKLSPCAALCASGGPGHGVRDRHKHAASASHRDDPGCSLGVWKQMPDSFSHELGELALRDLFFRKSFRSASRRGGQLRDERAPSAAGRVGNYSRRARAR